MAYNSTNILNTDIYKVSEFIDKLKAKYIDIPEDTLVLGVYGYLSSIFGNLLENTAITASEYSNEAIPTKAKYERNVISHALALGINSITAKPAYIDVTLNIPETQMVHNMKNNKFVIDKEYIFYIGETTKYPYHLDYDIIVTRHYLPNGEVVYTARYDLDNTNKLSSTTNPYLPYLGVLNISGDRMISIKTLIRQVTHTQIYKKVIINNPLETKIFSFTFEDQLAYFYVTVSEEQEDGTYKDAVYYEPIYDGLYDYTLDTNKNFINYSYLDEKTIRLRFDRDSQPRRNSEIVVHVYTTLGEKCNFKLNQYQEMMPYKSDKYPYTGMYIILMSMSDSHYGDNKLNISELKRAIPAEALSRGSISTYKDLDNFFNSLQRNDCRLYLLRKVHNQIERLYYVYLMMKDGNNIIPTNTINSYISPDVFANNNKGNIIIKPGTKFYADINDDTANSIVVSGTDQEKALDKSGFLYTNPYLICINKNPFYASYYLTLVNYYRELYFEYVNNSSIIQFVAGNVHVYRNLFDGYDTFNIDMTCFQSIGTDFQLVKYEDDGTTIAELNFRVYAILYRKNDNGKEYPFRYMVSNLVSYNQSGYQYDLKFKFNINDLISTKDSYIYSPSGLNNIKSGSAIGTYLPSNLKVKFFFVAKEDLDYGRHFEINKVKGNLDDLVPNLDGWSLLNVYSTGDDGIDIFYDYSDFNNSYIELTKDEEFGNQGYKLHKIPVVRDLYLNSNERVNKIVEMIDERRLYIQQAVFLLEDSFGIDYKFFNTYGKSKMYNIDRKENIDRINLSLKFEVKFQSKDESASTLDDITNSIKDYIEDINNLTDLHIPNLITYITNIYRDQLVYIKFIGLNDYESLYQSIYKNPDMEDNYFKETQTIPEFININTLQDGTPDITYKIIE